MWRPQLSALDPEKQGLKPTAGTAGVQMLDLSALDPGKQGLKQKNIKLLLFFLTFSA